MARKQSKTKGAAKPKESKKGKGKAAAPAKPKEPKAKSKPKVYPVVEGVQVLEILEDGRENATQYHCKMANGTTRHVDKELFE